MTDTQRTKKAAAGEGCIKPLPTDRWRAAIERKGVTYSKNSSREDVQAWLKSNRWLMYSRELLNSTNNEGGKMVFQNLSHEAQKTVIKNIIQVGFLMPPTWAVAAFAGDPIKRKAVLEHVEVGDIEAFYAGQKYLTDLGIDEDVFLGTSRF